MSQSQKIRPEWSNVLVSKQEDADFIAILEAWKKDYANHLVATGRIKAPEPGFRVVLATNRMVRDGIIGWAYTALPKAKELSEKERLQKELEEARLELEKLRAEAAKPRLVKSKA